jgi:gliding motility-associated-like protein
VTDVNGCSSDTSALVNGQIKQSPQIPSIVAADGGSLTRCAYDTLVLTASPFFSNCTYTWKPTGLVINGSLNLIVPDTFKVSLKVDSLGCSVNVPDTALAILFPLPKPAISSSEPDNRVCQGESITFTSNFDTGNLWIGSPDGLTTKEVTFDTTTTVILQVTDGNGCVNRTNPLTAKIDSLPTVTLLRDSAYSLMDDLILEATNIPANAVNFEWFRNGTSLGNTGRNRRFYLSADETAKYSVIITDENGCQSSDTIGIRVSSEVFIPNSFSPNKDGKNDFFKVYGFGVKEIQLQIWDRFGILVYESNDPRECVESGLNNDSEKGWNGEYQGKLLQQGSYIWSVKGKFNSGQDLKVVGGNSSGSVILLN